jgi:DivIVA domain-containing protein
MTDVHRRSTSSSRLSPEEIINRGFASAFRGVSETEVRNFLRRVADDLSAMRTRETELNRQIEELQERLANPPPVTEQQLLEALGEETARVLRSAQDAAEDMRKRAEERAAERVAEAKEAAERIRQEAEQQAATRTEVAERRAVELEKDAETRATQERETAEKAATELRETTTRETDAMREQAEQDAAAELETAKATSYALVEEATTVRERVLSDLARRRSLLQAQVDELRSGRDRLLDAYRVVKHTLGDATVALAQVEARANAELAAPPPRISVPPVEGELEVLQSSGEDDGGIDIDLDGESVVVLDEGHEGGTPASGGSAPGRGQETPDAEDSGAAVDALFARLRASHTADPAPGVTIPPGSSDAPAEGSKPDAKADPAPKVDGGPTTDGAPKTDAGPKTEKAKPEKAKPEPPAKDEKAKSEPPKSAPPAHSEPDAKSEQPAKDAKPDPPAKAAKPDQPTKAERSEPPKPAAKATKAPAEPGAPALSAPTPMGDDALRVARGEVLGPLTQNLVRRAKRALQDQQNEILAQIRTVKGKVESATVIPAADAQEAAWAEVLREPLTEAYAHSYGAAAAEGRSGPELPAELVDDLAQVMVESWRKRLVAAVDGAGDDTDAMTQRLGARYREYRGRELDAALGDAIAAVWARGTFDAVPDGTMLRWIPAEVGRCPDCDDNALETTARSEPFPTGQRFPPAHPGCRCFLVLAEPVQASR